MAYRDELIKRLRKLIDDGLSSYERTSSYITAQPEHRESYRTSMVTFSESVANFTKALAAAEGWKPIDEEPLY